MWISIYYAVEYGQKTQDPMLSRLPKIPKFPKILNSSVKKACFGRPTRQAEVKTVHWSNPVKVTLLVTV